MIGDEVNMNDKIKSQLRKYLQNYDYENFVLGDSRLNASVYKKFLFPYNALDYARNLLADTIKNYSIYFVLSCGRNLKNEANGNERRIHPGMEHHRKDQQLPLCRVPSLTPCAM